MVGMNKTSSREVTCSSTINSATRISRNGLLKEMSKKVPAIGISGEKLSTNISAYITISYQ